MKTQQLRWLGASALAVTALCFLSWKTAENNHYQVKYLAEQTQEDTIKPRKKTSSKKEYTVGDLDHAMKELDHAMQNLNKNINIDLGKMELEMKTALDEMKKIDFDKINLEVKTALKNVDWDKTRAEVDKALREAQVKMKEVDMKQIEKEMARAKEEMKAAQLTAKIDVDKIKKEVAEGMAKAKIGMEKAKKQIALLKEFTESLEKDGLIDRKKGYKIEVKKGELYINGTKQPKEVNDKYRKYFEDEDYSIKSDGDDFTSI
ncbi:MAG: hypothetical protein HYU70_14585 [Bacteroidetes bacterium]|nr:hypothetical protein [Bacteroidota bacterium]